MWGSKKRVFSGSLMELRPKVEREVKGVVFNPLWSEIGYRFLLFGLSEIECGVMRSLSEMVLCIFFFFAFSPLHQPRPSSFIRYFVTV